MLLALNVAWRLVRWLNVPPLWGDEAMLAINFLRRDFDGLTRPLAYMQLAPPGFLWGMEAITRFVGFGETALRAWPVLAGTCATFAFAFMAWRFLKRPEAVLAIVVLAASYYPLRHSVEVKPYSTDLLAAVLILWLTLAIRRRPTWGGWLLLTGLASVAAWVSFVSIFASGGAMLWLTGRSLLRGDRRGTLAGLVAGTTTLASFIGMFLVYRGVQAESAKAYRDMRMWSGAFPPLSRPWLLPWWLLDVHAGRMLAYPNGGRTFGSTATLLLCILGGVHLWTRRRRDLLILLLLPFGLGLLAASLGLYPYGRTIRTMLYTTPAICLLFGVGTWAIGYTLLRQRAVVGMIVLAGSFTIPMLVGMIVDTRHPYREPYDRDARTAVELLIAESQPGDSWVFVNSKTWPAIGEPQIYDTVVSGVLLFYAERDAPVPILHKAPPDELPSKGRVLLLAEQGFVNLNDADTQVAAYLEALGDRVIDRRVLTMEGSSELVIYEVAPSSR